MNGSKYALKRITKEKSAPTSKRKSQTVHMRNKEWNTFSKANKIGKQETDPIIWTNKANYNNKNGNKNLNCRACGKLDEKLNHILEECEIINKEESPTAKKIIFSECV